MKMIILCFAILCLGLLSTFIAFGQTNTIPEKPAATLPAYPDSTPADIEKVLNDFGITNINIPTIGGALFIIYAGVKFLRNKTPLGQGAIGQVLASVINLEAKQSPPEVSQSQTPPK